MSVWNTYEARLEAHGNTKREAALKMETRRFSRKMAESLSYFDVKIDGEERRAALINSDNLNEKTMLSLPGEDFRCGGLVEWAENHWLITERDANNEVYTRVHLLQCNYLLRWVDDTNEIREQWCVIEDGTKYLTGEYEDRNFVVARGDARIAMTIAKNPLTERFGRNKRFIIDDPASPEKMAFVLTKPLKVGHVYGGDGVYSFVLQEVVTTEDDNLPAGIADYYLHFPGERPAAEEKRPPDGYGKKVWL